MAINISEMSGGAVPPPRRQAPRSLVSAQIPQEPPRRRILVPTHAHNGDCLSSDSAPVSPLSQTQSQTSPGSGPFAFNHTLADHTTQEIRELHITLQNERNKGNRVSNALKDEKQKLQRSMRQQTQLEEELVSKDALIEGLSNELRLLKQKKQSADSELAQSTADYMNSQAKWVEQIDGLNDEVQSLRAKLTRCQAELGSANSELAAHDQRAATEVAAKLEQKEKAAQQDKTQSTVEDFSKRQDDLFISELQACHGRLKDEIRELKEVNERLREENEQYQYLVIERTVQGNITPGNRRMSPIFPSDSSTIDSTSASPDIPGMSLADDDVMYTLNAADTATEINSVSSVESSEGLQKTINKQQFELRSLQNHNNALRLSLERLVDRLLDNKTFSKAVEDSVSHVSVQRFRNRVASYSDQPRGAYLESMEARKIGEQESSPSYASVLSKMIFNNHYTGSPNRRVFSLGVDDEVRPPLSPSNVFPRYDGTPLRRASGNTRLSPMTFTFSPSKATSSSNSSFMENSFTPGGDPPKPTRTDGLTGVRKLRLS